jgi:peptide deformylase
MTILAVLAYPDPRLRTRAEPVRVFDAALGRFIDDLLETMYAERGIGLAATQVDVHRRILTLDVSGKAEAPEVFINPHILSRRRVALVEESCLSVPGVSERVRRATALRVRYQDRSGQTLVGDFDGLRAVCLGHEIDHLEGRLFVDRLPLFQRLGVRLRLTRQRRAGRAPLAADNGAAHHA